MGEVCSNLPANIVGPFNQTLFLGCTVKSFSSSVGWNDQETNVTVDLIEDPCAPAAGSTKYYYPRPGIVNTWNAADPGFQIPDVGAPVYFRVGDFEFAGVVQSWSKKEDSSSFPAYTVNISDPRFILENLTIITGDYAGEVKNVPNLINAYGFLESISDEVCQLDNNLECRDCEDTFLNGAQFGSPAEGFGGANQNDEGVPWIRLREAITLLLSGKTNSDYSPRGYAVFRGHTPVGIPAPANGMGRLPYDDFNSQIISSFNGNGYINKYIVDITEIPFAPTYYRISSGSQSLLSLISQVCLDAGCDFYIELIVTASLEKVIKVRTVKRRSQPDLGQIAQFLSTNNDYLISRDYGNELRNEPTSVFIYGANVESTYEIVPTGIGGTLDKSLSSPVVPHWGFDSDGNFQTGTLFSGDRYHQSGLVEWDFELDIKPLQQSLNKPLKSAGGDILEKVKISETELKLAMGGENAWYSYTFFVGVTGWNQNPYDPLNIYGTEFGSIIKQSNNYGTGITLKGLKPTVSFTGDVPMVEQSKPHATTLAKDTPLAKPNDPMKKDVEAIRQYIKNVGETNYNKKFVVKMDEICYYHDAQTDKNIFTDVPSNGGYPASGVSGVLNLDLNGTGIERFEEETTNKIAGIARYYVKNPSTITSGTLIPRGSDYVIKDTGLYVGLSADQKTYLFPTGTGDSDIVPAAVVTIDNPVFSGTGVSSYASFTSDILGNSNTPAAQTSGDAFGTHISNKLAESPNYYFPSGFAIPMFSNTNRYGPWGFVGPEGPVKFEEDDDLAPWNYGGYDLLNSGAIEKVQDGLTFQQVGERGGFTLAGYPIKSLGQDLRSPQTSYSSFVLQDGTSNYGDYKYINTTPMDGTFGPNITNINVSVGEGGATTTYSLATFTPSFGRMSKLNANRLKEIKKLRAQQKKQNRDLQRLNSAKARAGAGKDFNPFKYFKDLLFGFLGPENENQPKTLMVGGSATSALSGTDDEDANAVAHTDVFAQQAKGALTDEAYSKMAMMSQDGLTRAVSKSGDGELPGYVSSTTVVAGNEAHSQDPMGPINEWTMPIVARDYLDPLASVSTPKHCDDTNIYHDVDECAFGSTIDQANGHGTTNVKQFIANGNSCPDDFRFMALRGPLVINGWGYDLQGKPIPNSADNAADARSGIYTSSNLTDKFLPNWLKKSRTWPTAPVDLKFDRQRGVWTVPNSFRIVQVTAGTNISPGSSGTATISNPSTIYDGDGNSVSTQTISLNVPSWMPSGLVNGSGAYAFYDTSDSKWYAIFDTLGSGGSGGGGGNTTYIEANTYCSTGNTIAKSQLDVIVFDHGFEVTSAGSNEYLVKNDLRLDSNRFHNIVPRSGLSIELFGGCNYYLDASGTVVSATNGCSTAGAVTNQPTDEANYGDGLEVTVAGGVASINTVHKLGGSTFSNLILGSGLQATAGANCSYTIDNTYCPPVVEVQGDLSLNTVVDGTCKTYQISGCFPDLQVGKVGSTTVTSSTAAGCTTYTVSGDCLPEINVGTNGSTTVSKTTVGGCDTYTISGDCLPEIQVGKLGSTTVSKTTSAGCDTYTVSGDCLPVVQGAGGVSVSSSVSAGCTTYTVSGCDVNITAGTGITVVESAGGCSFEINADQACYPEVTVSDTCLILNTNTVGCKTTYDIDIDDSCKTGFEAPNWSLCGTPVNKDDNITFTASGCIEIDCAAGDVEIGVPCTQISGGDCISVTTNGTNDFTVSLASTGTAGSIQVVKDICCSGSGLNVVYTTLNFNSCGLFTGVSNVGSC